MIEYFIADFHTRIYVSHQCLCQSYSHRRANCYCFQNNCFN